MKNIKSKSKGLVSLFFLTSILAGCFGTPDQTIVKSEHEKLANPTPTARKFAEINKRHKVLMAVFDSGIDYNHPQLRDNVHFELDSAGKPQSLGYDYLGKDNWGSYRIVNTDIYNYEFQSADKKKEIDEQKNAEEFNKSIQSEIGSTQCYNDAVISVAPKASAYLDIYRATSYEYAGENIHGTHVAGLMTYDRPDFGLVAYRVLPYHKTKAEDREENLYKSDVFVNNIADALNRMKTIRDINGRGVRIVNLSLGGSILRPDSQDTQSSQEGSEQFERARTIVFQQLTQIIKQHPDVLFVAAAGNDSGWSDNRTRVQYPCGIEAKNILCVGALNNFEDLSSFTNIPLNDVDLVFAPGFEIKSLKPSDQCEVFMNFMKSTVYSGEAKLCNYRSSDKKWVPNPQNLKIYKPIIEAYAKVCLNNDKNYLNMSGTSMSTPIISHLAGEILADNPALTPPQVIQEIKKRALVRNNATFTAYVFEKRMLAVPSWSQSQKTKVPVNLAGTVETAKPVPSLLKSFAQGKAMSSTDPRFNSAWQRGYQEYLKLEKMGIHIISGANFDGGNN